MKVALLAGGVGRRLTEETATRPKPLVEIGGMPILWHILMHYSHYSFSEFVIALGYRGDQIKRFIVDYCMLGGSVTVKSRTRELSRIAAEGAVTDWEFQLVDTGERTGAGGRLKRLRPYLDEGTFLMTYADAVADVNLDDLIAFHKSHGRLATVTAVRPPGRFGRLELDGNQVTDFSEKSESEVQWINGGYFVLEPRVLDYIDDDGSDWGGEPLARLARDGQLMAYKHSSFWQCMDTIEERNQLEALWQQGKAPWKVWA